MRKILFAMMMVCFIMNSGFRSTNKDVTSSTVSTYSILNKKASKRVMVDITTEDIQIAHAYKILFNGNESYFFDVPSGSFASIGQIPEGWYYVYIFTKNAVENPPNMYFWLGYYGEGSYSIGHQGYWLGVYISSESNNTVGILPNL